MFSNQTTVFHLRPCRRPTVLVFHTESSGPLLAHLAQRASLLAEKLAPASEPLVSLWAFIRVTETSMPECLIILSQS